MASFEDKDRGLYPKYRAFKVAAHDTHDCELHDCEVTEPFFLLKFDANDQHARRALLVYALSVEQEGYYKLADDIRKKLHESRQLQHGDALDAAIMDERAQAAGIEVGIEEYKQRAQEKLARLEERGEI